MTAIIRACSVFLMEMILLRELWRGGTTPDESETLEEETKSEVQPGPAHLSLAEHLRQNSQ